MSTTPVQTINLFLASQLALVAVFTPWSILKEEYDINPCTLPQNYQFRQWGGACEYDWQELKDVHQTGYFAMIHTLTKIRIFSIICVLISTMCLCCQQKHRYKQVTFANIMIFIFSMMATTMYYTDQNTTMVLPIRILRLQGPGFWSQVLVSSFALSYVFIEFFISYKSKR